MAELEPERPIDPRNPTGHKATQHRLDKEDAAAKKKAADKYDNDKMVLAQEFIDTGHWERMRRAGGFEDRNIPEIYHHPAETLFTAEEMVELRIRHKEYVADQKRQNDETDRDTAETKRLRDAGLPDTRRAPIVQTLKLSLEAQRRLGLFGTPESMTDEQIAETNEAYSTPAPDKDDEENWL
jgi:hypothetical protein